MEKLNKLAHVSLLPHANLTDLKDRLIKLQTCFALIKDNLESSATCPHCGFRPVESERSLGASGMQVLEEVDQQMDDLVTQWTSALLENLNDPTAQESLNLLPAKQKKAVSQLLQDKELPDKVDNDFVQAIQSALSGLTAIPVTPQELTEALGGGTPCTVEQFEHRFEKFLEKTLVGKDRAKVRLVVKKDEGE